MQSLIHLNGKGKVERCFRTVKDKFFNCLDWNRIINISQVQKMYDEFLNKEYINKEHSAIQQTPRERFMKDFSNIKRITDEQIEELYIYNDKNERVCSIKAIDKISNSMMKRNEKISMYRKEEV